MSYQSELTLNILCPGIRPYKCNQCEANFVDNRSLKTHALKIHGMKIQGGIDEAGKEEISNEGKSRIAFKTRPQDQPL